MTRTRFTLDDLGGELSERALLSFVRRLPAESETVAELLPDGGWSRADMLLARLCEGVEALAWITANKGNKKNRHTPLPERIERPGVKREKRQIGRKPIPISDFNDWYFGGDANG